MRTALRRTVAGAQRGESKGGSARPLNRSPRGRRCRARIHGRRGAVTNGLGAAGVANSPAVVRAAYSQARSSGVGGNTVAAK